MREKDLRPGTDQVLESEYDYLLRVLGKAPDGETYEVTRKYRTGSEGRYACVRLSLTGPDDRVVGDPDLLKDVTLEDFTEGRELASGVSFEAIDSLVGLSEASEQVQHEYLERRAKNLVETIELGLSQMADRWDQLKPKIIELSYPRMWKTALGHASWEACVQAEFGAVLARWRDTGVLEQRVLELTTGDDAMSNRMVAVIAGTSEWTVRQIRKQAGVIGGTSRGSDAKSRPATRPPVKRAVPIEEPSEAAQPAGPVIDAESTQERPELAETPRRFIPRKEQPAGLAKHQAERMAEDDAYREHLRPDMEARGGKVREREQRKTIDPVTELEVHLAKVIGAMLHVTPDDTRDATEAVRARLVDTIKEARQMGLELLRELKSYAG